MSEYSKALSSHERSLEIKKKALPPNHPSLAGSYLNIGLAYSNMGEYSKALSSQERSLEIRKIALPPNHPDFAQSYNNIGMAKILGIESRYGAICRSFHELAFKDNDSEHSFSFEENDMIKYFESFARVSISTFETTGFESHMAYQGYIDDLRNTDNAWVEAEIWNFHYDSNIPFPNLRQDGVAIWKDVTNNFRGFLIQTSMLREITRIHQAFFK
ncbi:unnamed protein product [Rotaria sordida]|uniref:Tetratricopeptide repeat protein n=1 Tax=Rotaria sordida TaxID=392033 RepID=A0A814XY73_9BILA|nr:unnamed protein product [Rotaria sordida]